MSTEEKPVYQYIIAYHSSEEVAKHPNLHERIELIDPYVWRCWAEDGTHAIEQFLDESTNKDTAIVSVILDDLEPRNREGELAYYRAEAGISDEDDCDPTETDRAWETSDKVAVAAKPKVPRDASEKAIYQLADLIAIAALDDMLVNTPVLERFAKTMWEFTTTAPTYLFVWLMNMTVPTANTTHRNMGEGVDFLLRVDKGWNRYGILLNGDGLYTFVTFLTVNRGDGDNVLIDFRKAFANEIAMYRDSMTKWMNTHSTHLEHMDSFKREFLESLKMPKQENPHG